MRAEYRRDLAGLHPEAADLDLIVQAPEELQRPVRAPASQVPGPVQARAGPGRIGHERPRRGRGVAGVAAGQPVPAGTQLTSHANRRGPPALVENVHGGLLDRAANRHGQPDLPRISHHVAGGEGGVLGRAVPVDQRLTAAGGQHGAHRVRIEHVAAREDDRDAGERVDIRLGHLVEQPGGEPGDGYAGRTEQGRDIRQPERGRRGDHYGAAGQQRAPDFQRGNIERDRGQQQQPLARAEPGEVWFADEPDHGALRHGDALRHTGRA